MPRARFSRRLARPALLAGIGAALTFGSYSGAAAAAGADSPATSAYAHLSSCDANNGSIELASARALVPTASAKTAAILGGQPSALDRIRMAQETGQELPGAPAADLAAATNHQLASLEPAAGGLRPAPARCARRPDQLAQPAAPRGLVYSPDDFLASKRLAIGRTPFDSEWQRVSSERVSASRLQNLVGATPADPLETMRSVNAWVNRAIKFTEDRDLFGRADYWAGAKKTLKLGRGDCEDIALTKMQLLAAVGIPREDMVLTIARDLVRNADHALLIVRREGRYYMLDNSTDEVLDASSGHDYRPVLSFGQNATWLHGY